MTLDPTSPQVLAAYTGGLLSGLFALAGMMVTARNERLRQVEAARREDIIWFRNAIAKAYSEALYYLFKLSVSSSTAPKTDTDVRQHLSESQRNLLLLYAYQADPDKKAALMAEVTILDSADANLAQAATSAAKTVRDQFQADPRLNVKK